MIIFVKKVLNFWYNHCSDFSNKPIWYQKIQRSVLIAPPVFFHTKLAIQVSIIARINIIVTDKLNIIQVGNNKLGLSCAKLRLSKSTLPSPPAKNLCLKDTSFCEVNGEALNQLQLHHVLLLVLSQLVHLHHEDDLVDFLKYLYWIRIKKLDKEHLKLG